MGLLEIRGTHLWVEDLGSPDKPPVLYLHGGPGAGCYDFVLQQGERLSQSLRVIALDQRGVLRSDPLEDSLTLQDLIEDCEALRVRLGIERWSVLGHSFGGYLGLAYALRYPEAVSALVFENPSFDIRSSVDSLLHAAALEYGALGEQSRLAQCMGLINSARQTPRDAWAQAMDLLAGLGDRRNSLYVHGQNKDFFDAVVAGAPFPADRWERGLAHVRALEQDGAMFDPLTPYFGNVEQPTLLIRGKYDAVFGLDQIYQYLCAKPDTHLLVATQSGHFVRVEEPELFCSAVADFCGRRP